MSDESRLLAAWYRIGGECQNRVVSAYERILNVKNRLEKCMDTSVNESWEDEQWEDIKEIRQELVSYGNYCSKQLNANVTDPDTMESEATYCEDKMTDIENKISEVESYCTSRGS